MMSRVITGQNVCGSSIADELGSRLHLHRITVNNLVSAIARSGIIVIAERIILQIGSSSLCFFMMSLLGPSIGPGIPYNIIIYLESESTLTTLELQLCHDYSKHVPIFGWTDAIASERTSSEEHMINILSLSKIPWS